MINFERQVRIDKHKVKVLMALRNIDTQRELVKRSGLHESTVIKVLNGEGFKSETLERLAGALECSPMDLLRVDGYPSPLMDAPSLVAA